MGLGCRLLSGRGGFTLLELLLVVTVLSAVAWMSLGVVSNNSDQVRFEDTRNRLQAIRRAIIGDTSRTVNGGPEIRGYVADMGRLPTSLQELVSREYCEDHPEYTTKTNCENEGETWNSTAQPNSYAIDSGTGIWAGWNGPYLPAGASLSADGPKFLDGWGNDDQPGDFGWNYSLESDGDVLVQSYGRDGTTTGTEVYDAEYPDSSQPIITAAEYRQEIGTITVVMDLTSVTQCFGCSITTYNTKQACISGGGTWQAKTMIATEAACLNNNPALGPIVNGEWGLHQKNVCLAIAYHKNGTFYKDATNVPYIATSSQPVTYNGAKDIVSFVFATGNYLQLGQAAYAIVEADSSPACPVTQFVDTYSFPSGAPLWTPFTYVPGTTLQPFERKITSY